MKEIDVLVKDKIHTIRGFQVILDRDLASLYEVEPIRLREQVKRNIERFPEDFMFRLTEKEVNLMVSQYAIPSKKLLGGSLPYAFTEQGVSMLSGVLRSSKAVEVNIKIMRAFVAMRRFMLENLDNLKFKDYVISKLTEHDNSINKLFLELPENEFKDRIFYDCEFFDAYKFIIDLIKKAKKKIVLIDNYVRLEL